MKVFIATTTGPVAVQRITKEDPEVSSVVCLAGKAVALPISDAYDAFVRDPIGIVQRHFGHSAYRVDVSDKIDDGFSWQLGLFAAHALAKGNCLTGSDEEAEAFLFVTGEVDRDLNILPVDHVADKLEQMCPELKRLESTSAKILLALPQGNRDTDIGAWLRKQGISPKGVKIIYATTAHDLISNLEHHLPTIDLQLTISSGKNPSSDFREPSSRVVFLTALIGVVSLSAIAGGIFFGPKIKSWIQEIRDNEKPLVEVTSSTNKAKEIKKSSRLQAPIELQIAEHRPPPGRSCLDVRRGKVPPKVQLVRRRTPLAFAPSIMENLCRVEIIARSKDSDQYLMGRYKRWTNGRPGDATPDKTIDLGPQKTELRWTFDLPKSLGRSVAIHIAVFTSYNKTSFLNNKLDVITRQLWSGDAPKIISRLRGKGISVAFARYHVVLERHLRRSLKNPLDIKPDG